MKTRQRLTQFNAYMRALPGKKALAKAFGISALNQVVCSGTNFIFGIYLVRVLLPEDFGMYGIGFAVCLFYAGIGNALFLTQMVVNAVDKTPEDRLPYAGRMFILLGIFCFCSIVLLAALLLLGINVWTVVASYIGFALAVAVVSIAYLVKEFFVRHAYNIRQETWALFIHVIIAITMVFLLILRDHLNMSINASMALWIYAVANISGAFAGYLLARLPVLGQKRSVIYEDLCEIWEGGKWASISNFLYAARTQAHTIVVTALLGAFSVAQLNASRMLISPATILIPVLSQIATPRLASARKQGESYLFRMGCWITVALLMGAFLYIAVLLSSYSWIKTALLGSKYQDLFLPTIFWCFYVCMLTIRNGAEMVMQVRKEFKKLTAMHACAGMAALLATFMLTVVYGLLGSLIGIIIGELVLFCMLLRSMFKTLPTRWHA